MQIKQTGFLDLMGMKNTRFVIPVFQRVYSWDARQCEELWEDVMNVGAQPEDRAEPHFMGMLLYSTDTETWNGAQQLDVIDGQQRMTTVSLLLCALARYLDETDGHVGDPATGQLSAGDLFNRYLRTGSDTTSTGKLALSYMDRPTMFALLGLEDMPEAPAGRLIDNLELFFGKMQEPDFDAQRLWRGLQRLEVAGILLAHDDSPQLVFESLNSKGMALSTGDRIRNYIVVADEANGRETGGVFEGSWLPLEKMLAENASGTGTADLDITTVVHAWLAEPFRATRILDKAQIYGLFKSKLRSDYNGDMQALLADVTDYARKLMADEDFRTEQLHDAERWVAGKPKNLISEYKMFGD